MDTTQKTTEQIKQEIINYLDKTSKHTFIKPNATFKYGNPETPGYFEYDYEDFTTFKVSKGSINPDIYYVSEDGKTREIDVNYFVKYYGVNAKNVIKQSLFLNKKMLSVKIKMLKSKEDDPATNDEKTSFKNWIMNLVK